VKEEALGTELFAVARKAAGDSFGPEFAFYWAQVNPAEARLRMEVEFAQRLHGDNPQGRFFSLVPPMLAMSAVDVDRALELARSIPETDPNTRFDAQRKIAQYVLASQEVRRTMPFDRWCASDTWIPGTSRQWGERPLAHRATQRRIGVAQRGTGLALPTPSVQLRASSASLCGLQAVVPFFGSAGIPSVHAGTPCPGGSDGGGEV
jgi:hypothetical protein